MLAFLGVCVDTDVVSFGAAASAAAAAAAAAGGAVVVAAVVVTPGVDDIVGGLR
jgi:hypothetical protein